MNGPPPMRATLRLAVLALLATLALGAAGVVAQPAPSGAPRAAPSVAPDAAQDAAQDAYRGLFSAEAIGARSAGVRLGWTLAYRGMMPNSAFAYAEMPDGRALWNAINARPDEATARNDALAACRRAVQQANIAAECRLFAVNGRIVAPGRERAAPGLPVAREIGPFRASPLHFWHGPAAARGVVIHGHGYGGRNQDRRNSPAQGWLSVFNDAGWDILRFDRAPNEDDMARSTARLQRGVVEARAAGYRQIVLAGQSRGGWQALRVVADPDTAALVAAVIAIAPAAHGRWDRRNRHASQLGDWQQLLRALPAERVRILTVLFRGDPFDAEIDERLAAVASAALARPAPMLALSPGDSAIEGHSGGMHWAFAARYGRALVAFVTAPEAEARRGIARAPW